MSSSTPTNTLNQNSVWNCKSDIRVRACTSPKWCTESLSGSLIGTAKFYSSGMVWTLHTTCIVSIGNISVFSSHVSCGTITQSIKLTHVEGLEIVFCSNQARLGTILCLCVEWKGGGGSISAERLPGGVGGLRGWTHTHTHIEDWNIHIKFHASGMFAWKRKCNVAYSDLIILVD